MESIMTTTDVTATSPIKRERRTPTPDRGAAKPPTPQSKSDLVAKLLARAKGATVAEVSGVTGWQSHSVRAFLSGLRKKDIGLVRDARKSGEACYRTTPPVIADDAPDVVAAPVAAMQPVALAEPNDLASNASVV